MMDSSSVNFGPWEPDDAILNGRQATEARNVIPAKAGYRSFGSLVDSKYIDTTPARVFEAFVSKSLDGSLITAVANANKIRMLENGSWVQRWNDTPLSEERWFAQYGDAIYAVFGSTLVKQASRQTAFQAVEDAPDGELLAVIRDFLVLGRVDGVDNKIQWSGIDRPDEWPEPGSDEAQYIQSDVQVFPEGGKVMGFAAGVGGTDGIVFLERAIQRMTYVGTPYIFQFDPIDREYGLIASKSAVVCGNVCCYLSDDGWRMTDGATVKNIGAERVDQWFYDQCDPERISEVRGVHDPSRRIAVWSFPSNECQLLRHDRLIIYSYLLDKWSYAVIDTECLFADYSRGLTLEELDAYGDLDHLRFASLDSAALKNGGRILGAVTPEHQLASFNGPALEAVIDTAEAGGGRMMLHGFRPLVDCGNAKAMPIWRDLQKGQRVYGEYAEQTRDGICYQHISCDYAAARVMIPEGEDWKSATGVEFLTEPEGWY